MLLLKAQICSSLDLVLVTSLIYVMGNLGQTRKSLSGNGQKLVIGFTKPSCVRVAELW